MKAVAREAVAALAEDLPRLQVRPAVEPRIPV
jgi:hypothetical protein